MTNVARIFVQGGTLTFDADVPYDQQLLFEQADRYARWQGSVQLLLDDVQWTVSVPRRAARGCSSCGARMPALIYSHQRRCLCARCARAQCFVPRLDEVGMAGRKPPRRKRRDVIASQLSTPHGGRSV
jgi:hypothetical protein